ncbi:hypothetical protein [Aquimarina sp. RZ0]|uniref:hypothetical protein n=1 Tax=Aquimarina sp. RZ0 TaxID=2607730 RepID=UPI0011F27443|nr:hypothetical protein [Aquimarina sp. RZ0]KAA1243885.1 hypothetical protein F0000_19105 [Aquimarina sp. RZ0]
MSPIELRGNFLIPGVEAEIGVTRTTTFLANAGIIFSASTSEDSNGNSDSFLAFLPIIDLQYRFYTIYN